MFFGYLLLAWMIVFVVLVGLGRQSLRQALLESLLVALVVTATLTFGIIPFLP